MRHLRSMIARIRLSLVVALVLAGCSPLAAQERLQALIVDGQNNHGVWPRTTRMMRDYLEETGRFSVDVATTAAEGIDRDFHPPFSEYDVVISNYNGSPWPEETRQAFVDYVAGGGGFVVVHAANNAFGDWREYNEIIGLGGWGGRDERSGPYVYFNDDGDLVRDDSAGSGGHHGPQHEFAITIRDPDHPITQGMPGQWMHAQDELYDFLRGPAASMEVLATAYASPDQGGSGRHEPMIMTIEYGKGRVFHTPMGQGDYSMECVGYLTTFQRGTEWAATGEVTIEIPDDFPTIDATRSRPFDAEDR